MYQETLGPVNAKVAVAFAVRSRTMRLPYALEVETEPQKYSLHTLLSCSTRPARNVLVVAGSGSPSESVGGVEPCGATVIP